MRMLSVLLAACTLLLVGCKAPSLTNQALADDYSAGVAVEMAKLSMEDGTTPSTPDNKVPRAQCKECHGTGKVRSGDGLITYDCDACYAGSAIKTVSLAMPGQCACGDGCQCAKELAALRDYRDRMEAWLKSQGLRQPRIVPGRDLIMEPQEKAVMTSGSCANGQCSVSGYSRPVRRGWFGRGR